MRKVKFPIKISQNQGYEVYINSNQRLRFTNKRSAERFIVKYQNLVNVCLFDLNLEYANVFSLYRQNYFLYKPLDTTRINRVVTEIQTGFNQVFFECKNSQNAIPYTVKRIKAISSSICDIVKHIYNVSESRGEHQIRRQASSIKRSIEDINNRLDLIDVDAVKVEFNDLGQEIKVVPMTG